MLPDLWVLPNLLAHLVLCAIVARLLWRRLARQPAVVGALWTTVGVVAFGLALGALTAPARGAFALLLTWSWTLGLVLPAVLLWVSTKLIARRAARFVGYGLLAAAVGIVALTVDAFCVEPTALEVTHHVVRSTRVARPLRIAVIADLQTDAPGPYEARALTRVMDAQPDLILFPGDLIQLRDPEAHAAAWAELSRIVADVGLSAPLGVWVTQGDSESADWKSHARAAGLRPLGAGLEVRPDVRLTGLDLQASAGPQSLVRAGPAFSIVVGHRPDFALGDSDADLLLAGHTHGGQVQLPWVGPLITLSAVPRAWADGLTQLGRDTTLIVSRGVGMERGVAPRLRLWCAPEVVIVDVLPAHDGAL